MKLLKDRILSDGRCFPGGILKVDGFINHQMDPNLMKSIAAEFSKRYSRSVGHCSRYYDGFSVRFACGFC